MATRSRIRCAASHTAEQPNRDLLHCPECLSNAIFPDGHPVPLEDDDCSLIHTATRYVCKDCGYDASGALLVDEVTLSRPASSYVGRHVIYQSLDGIPSSAFIVSIDDTKIADLTVIGFGKVDGVRAVPYSANKGPRSWAFLD